MILFDAGTIGAAAFTTEDYYQVCTELFAGLRLANRRLLLPQRCQLSRLLDRQARRSERESGFLAGVAEGGFERSI